MLNNSAVTYYAIYILIFKGPKDKATNNIEKWSLSSDPLLTDTLSHENRSKRPQLL